MANVPPDFSFALPIDAVLGELRAKSAAHTRLVLVAPPGAGKTTAMVAVAFAAIVRPFEKRTKTRLVLYKSTFL